MNNRKMVALAGALAAGIGAATAQTTQVPVPEEPSTSPQIQIDGVGIGTLQYATTSGAGNSENDTTIDFSDSSLTVGAAQRLYRGKAVGSMVLGFLTPDTEDHDESGKTELFVHQAFADYQSRDLEAYIGRTSGPAAQLVDFPTIREDDLMSFTHLLNPFSSGENPAEHRYGNVAAVTLNSRLKYFTTIYGQHLLNTADEAGGSGVNSGGVTVQYLGAPGLENLERVAQWGVGYERRAVSNRLGGASNALVGSAVINLRPSMVRRVDLRLFGSTTFGNSTDSFTGEADAFRADSTAVAASLRSLSTPFGHPGSQVALTAGYRHYAKVNDADSFGVALTGVKRLGQGFDLVSQYSWEHRDDALAEAMGGRNEHRVQIGFVFNFQSTINKHISPRRTLLNTRHQYIPE